MNFNSDMNVVDLVICWLCLKIDDVYELKLIYMVCGMGYVFEVCGGVVV